MILRALSIALLSIALPAYATDTREAADENNVPLEASVCPMMFLPASCSVTYGGESYEATATNSCVALSELVQKVRDAAMWFVDPASDVRTGASCTALEE